MSQDESGAAEAQPRLLPLPRIEELPTARKNGLDPAAVEEAFRRFELYVASLRGHLEELQQALASRETGSEPGRARRAEALDLIQAAAVFAETMERDAREAAEQHMRAAEQGLQEQRMRLAERELELSGALEDLGNHGRAILAAAEQEAQERVKEGELACAHLLEAAREQAIEITAAARADVERQLEWARAQGAAVLRRARSEAAELRPVANAG